MNLWVFVKCELKSSQLKEPKTKTTSVCMRWIRVSQFELNYWNNWIFSRHSNLLRCTCTVCLPRFGPNRAKLIGRRFIVQMDDDPNHTAKTNLGVFKGKKVEYFAMAESISWSDLLSVDLVWSVEISLTYLVNFFWEQAPDFNPIEPLHFTCRRQN